MNAIVIEHVPVADLPAEWRAKLAKADDSLVTVRIEEEAHVPVEAPFADDPLFGMWRDREDMADVRAYVRKLRASRLEDGLQRNS